MHSKLGLCSIHKFRSGLRHAFAALLILCVSASVFAQEGHFPQKLQWKADKNALYYQVELQTAKTGKSTMIKTEQNQIELSLQPGKYRYRVYVYDFLGREAGVNSWTDFEILKASHPVFVSVESTVNLPLDSDVFDIKIDVSGVSAKSTVRLINQQTGHSVNGELFLKGASKVQSETERAEKARFSYVRAGNWKIKITNPSGFSSESAVITIVDSARTQLEAQTKQMAENQAAALAEAEKKALAEAEKEKKEQEKAAAAKAAEEKRLAELEKEAAKKAEKKREESLPVSEKQEKAVRTFLSESAHHDVTISPVGRGHSEFGMYLSDYKPLDRMENHSYNNMGIGLSYALHFNQKKRVHAGLCLHADGSTVMANLDYIEEWYAVGIFGGLFVQMGLTSFFSIVPQVESGVQLDFVRSSKTPSTWYTSPAVQASLEFKISPQYIGLDGLSIALAPYYRFALEKDGDMARYLGGRLSFLYHAGKKKRVDTSPWAAPSVKDDLPSGDKE